VGIRKGLEVHYEFFGTKASSSEFDSFLHLI
jgi:hypothetical protein